MHKPEGLKQPTILVGLDQVRVFACDIPQTLCCKGGY